MDSFSRKGVFAVLVLSRKENQQILFPGLGIEVSVCRISGKSVSVGVNAPKSVQILRGELRDAVGSKAAAKADTSRDESQHELRNQLNKAQLTVAIAQKQLQMGKPQDAEQTLQEMLNRLTAIEQSISQPVSERDLASDRVSDRGQGGRRALVVEDDANERALMAGFLRLCGFQISEAADGVEAIEFLTANDVDLIVLDMQMPRMDGKATLREIRRQKSLHDTMVIVVSGNDRNHSLSSGDEKGVTEWFSKPLDASRFASYLEATI